MAKEQVQLRDPLGVILLAQFWFEEYIGEPLAEKIAARAIEMEVGETMPSRCRGCLSYDGDWGSAFCWLKTRLREHEALPWGWNRAVDYFEYQYHVATLPPPDEIAKLQLESFAPIAYDLWRETIHVPRSTLCRSPLSRVEPIDAVARRLTRFNDDQACPYCKRRYRNGAALRLHVVESHGVTE